MEPRIREWAARLADRELKAFLRARRRFQRKPNAERLHLLRCAGCRLRALYDDLGPILPPLPIRRLRSLMQQAGDARDASVSYRILKSAMDDGEREIVAPALRAIRRQDRAGRVRIRRELPK